MNMGGIHPRLLAAIITLSRVLVLAMLLWLVLILQALADPAQTAALEAGKQFGSTGVSSFTLPGVTSDSLPGFVTGNPEEVQHQSAGMGLEDKARSVLFSASPDNASGQTLHSILNRPVFKLGRDDPLVGKTDQLLADAGKIGADSGCRQVVVTDPIRMGVDTCMEYLKPEMVQCKRTLETVCKVRDDCLNSVQISPLMTDIGIIPVLSGDTLTITYTPATTYWWHWWWQARWEFSKLDNIRAIRLETDGRAVWIDTNSNSTVIGSYGAYYGHGSDLTGLFKASPYFSIWKLDEAIPIRFVVSMDCQCSQWEDVWGNDCIPYTSNPACEVQSSACTDTVNPHQVDGEDVSRDCWQYTDTYQCYNSQDQRGEDDYCAELRKAGCTQTGSHCDETLYGRCVAWEQTYQCTASGNQRTIEDCSGQAFCMDGDKCFDSSYAPNGDFGQAASYLSSAESAAKDFDTSNMLIFSGQNYKCKKTALGFKNCCRDSGWGIGWNLTQCSESEIILGEKQAAGLCHFVGTYKDKSLFPNRYNVSCCFNSKLARIIHEQGRSYVPLDWGSARNPVCRGFTPDELARVDFGKLDFSEFFADALTNADKAIKPGMDNLSDLIKDKILQQLPGKR
ncbi:MAG TPA: conjugal transfer protein TraN [Candidatus Thiothrix moscowensis]|uniref:conjugal transfer protein TraN n=1 Tax=unclassified Thiothrix TaxID=2636184 RepID=UPI0025D61E39|nr:MULTISPECIES: conjugal transfer protein TraN [unclassified Thiothrix]HRJ52243.1 conjugal transfer protein TraN [Candidatus Thiothrix moscowensis]HRJ92558.1 conjugal transfer protein TraN [Candidatus Thiothrix moscowensis]